MRKPDIHPEWLGGVNPDAIERQEAEGQVLLLTSGELPVEGSDSPGVQALGIQWNDPSTGDPLFLRAVLPAGWTLRATGSTYWTDVVDETGVVRAEVFYKAAFYDRRAFIQAT